MRKIKFRGRFWSKGTLLPKCPENKDGALIYGGYVHMTFLLDDGEGDYIVNDEGTARLAYPESIAQLVGYDKDGNEVYEGDELVNERGEIFFAQLINGVLTDEGFLHEIPVEVLKLKEEPKP